MDAQHSVKFASHPPAVASPLLSQSSSQSPPTPALQLDEAPVEPFAPTKEPSPEPSEPLYTEINIPLPHIPTPAPVSVPSSPPQHKSHDSRCRAHSLSALSPFHRRSPESSRSPSPTRSIFSRPRTGTLDAAAVLPAVLMLSTEMFTPKNEEQRDATTDGIH